MRTLITKDRLDALVQLCGETPRGSGVEVGVYKGGSLKTLAEAYPDRHFWGFDTFEGLPPEHWSKGEVHKPGDFNDTSLQEVSNYLKLNLNVILVKGLFPESMIDWLYPTFVHVDTDFYEAIKACIEVFYPRLPSGGIMVFDDYKWERCPGVEKALKETNFPIYSIAEYQAYIKKP